MPDDKKKDKDKGKGKEKDTGKDKDKGKGKEKEKKEKKKKKKDERPDPMGGANGDKVYDKPDKGWPKWDSSDEEPPMMSGALQA